MDSERKRFKKGHKSFKSIKIRTKKKTFERGKRPKKSIIFIFLNIIINLIKNIF